MAFLEFDRVSKGFGTNASWTEVLREVQLSIEEGEFVAIIGYSGSGKTTLISLMAGLITPDRGRISLNGREITGPGPDRGIVFQNYSLLPWLTAFENVYLAVDQAFPHWNSFQKQQQTDRFIEMVNLAGAAGQRP